jgi:hypothetical protein
MVYETGVAYSTFDLFDKLTEFMKTVNGWQLWSNIDGYEHMDFVYRSSGSDERKDIFIRQRIGQPEPCVGGTEQYDYGNGDTRYLNFFSYLYYPPNGDAYAGASEVGAFGPRLFLFNAHNEYRKLYYQDFLGQKKGAAAAVAYGTPAEELDSPEWLVDDHCVQKRRWSDLNCGNFGYGGMTKFTTDGKRFLYIMTSNGTYQYSMARAGGAFDSSGDIVDEGVLISSNIFYYLCFFQDRHTGKDYLFAMEDESDEGVTIMEVDGDEVNRYGSPVSVSVVNGPTWPTPLGSSNSYTVQKAKASVWDGKRYIYVLRGGTGTNNYKSPDWGRFDTQTNEWITNSVPENPDFEGFARDLDGTFDIKFMSKDITGYDYDRLYVYASSNIYVMDLGDDGMPSSTNPSWYIIDDVSLYFSYNDARFILSRSGRLFAYDATANGPQNKYDEYQLRPTRSLYYSDFDPDGGDWVAEDAGYAPFRLESYASYVLVDGYACRVKCEGTTSYVFIGDEDRIIVATSPSTSQRWSVAYMGAFESVYDSDPYGVVDGDINAGRFRKIKIKQQSGSFVVGEKYFITGNNGPIVYKKYEPDGRVIPVGPSESITIVETGDDYIVASIYNDYNDGAKIGIDPQPVGVFFCDLEKFQTTNVVNRLDDDFNGSDSPSKQTYTIPISEDSIQSGNMIEGYTFLYDCTISTGESEGNHIGREIRGRMKGVFAVGSRGVPDGATVEVNGDAYKIISITGYRNKHLAIGPIT